MTQYWVRGHAGIGSNTGVLDPIPSRIEDRRLKMQEKVSGASSIFNLRSRTVLDPRIRSNTGVLDPISET